MRLEQILDETLELLIANAENPKFKSFGDLQKSKFQNSNNEEYKDNKRQMYEGCIGNSEAVKKGHITRKSKKVIMMILKKLLKKDQIGIK